MPTEYNEVVFTTVTTSNYLPLTIVMAQSIKKQMPNSKVIVCLVEEQLPDALKAPMACFDQVITAKALGFANFYRYIFQYNQFEGANACKAQLLIHLMETYQNQRIFIFLASDIKVYSPFQELIDLLTTEEIIVSPHFIQFQQEDPLYHLGVVHSSGIFNTCLIAVKRSDESRRFLHWWAKLLSKYCYIDLAKGMWNEQKWLVLTPGLFNCCVQKDPGYNVGPWNFNERPLALVSNGQYKVNGLPLRFLHYSGAFGKHFMKRLIRVESSNQRAIIEGMLSDYLCEVEKADQEGCL